MGFLKISPTQSPFSDLFYVSSRLYIYIAYSLSELYFMEFFYKPKAREDLNAFLKTLSFTWPSKVLFLILNIWFVHIISASFFIIFLTSKLELLGLEYLYEWTKN